MRVGEAASQLLTLPEAAAFIGVGYGTVHAQIKRNRLATVATYGGSPLITLDEARRYKTTVSHAHKREADPTQLVLPHAGD